MSNSSCTNSGKGGNSGIQKSSSESTSHQSLVSITGGMTSNSVSAARDWYQQNINYVRFFFKLMRKVVAELKIDSSKK